MSFRLWKSSALAPMTLLCSEGAFVESGLIEFLLYSFGLIKQMTWKIIHWKHSSSEEVYVYCVQLGSDL